MKIRDVMTPRVETCFTEDSLATAARRMWERDCGCVPVLNDQARVVGMIMDRDVSMAVFFKSVPMSEKQGIHGDVAATLRLCLGW